MAAAEVKVVMVVVVVGVLTAVVVVVVIIMVGVVVAVAAAAAVVAVVVVVVVVEASSTAVVVVVQVVVVMVTAAAAKLWNFCLHCQGERTGESKERHYQFTSSRLTELLQGSRPHWAQALTSKDTAERVGRVYRFQQKSHS